MNDPCQNNPNVINFKSYLICLTVNSKHLDMDILDLFPGKGPRSTKEKSDPSPRTTLNSPFTLLPSPDLRQE